MDDRAEIDDDAQIGGSLDVVRLITFYRLAKLSIICLTVFGVIWLISDAAVKIFANNDPPWLKLASIIGTVLVALLTQWAGLLKGLRRLKKYMKNYHDRQVKLEISVDPNRQSSEISKQGTTPYDT